MMEIQHKRHPRVGSELYLPRFGGYCVVEANDDPSLVTLMVPSGALAKVGDKALREMLLEVERQDAMVAT